MSDGITFSLLLTVGSDTLEEASIEGWDGMDRPFPVMLRLSELSQKGRYGFW
jgi:hypothetical protein